MLSVVAPAAYNTDFTRVVQTAPGLAVREAANGQRSLVATQPIADAGTVLVEHTFTIKQDILSAVWMSKPLFEGLHPRTHKWTGTKVDEAAAFEKMQCNAFGAVHDGVELLVVGHLCSMANHSATPNAVAVQTMLPPSDSLTPQWVLHFVALAPIAAGDEVTVAYARTNLSAAPAPATVDVSFVTGVSEATHAREVRGHGRAYASEANVSIMVQYSGTRQCKAMQLRQYLAGKGAYVCGDMPSLSRRFKDRYGSGHANFERAVNGWANAYLVGDDAMKRAVLDLFQDNVAQW